MAIATPYIILSHIETNRANIEITTNNIANINTPGFKSMKGIQREVQVGTSFFDHLSYVQSDGIAVDMTQGAISRTDGDLDFALNGIGYFSVEGPNQKVFYTRAGQFTLNENGEISTPDGYKLLSSGGSPIAIPENTKTVIVNADGSVYADQIHIDSIGVFEFDPASPPRRAGSNLLEATADPQESLATVINQYHLEESNASPALLMANLVKIQREDELDFKLLELQDEADINEIEHLLVSSGA